MLLRKQSNKKEENVALEFMQFLDKRHLTNEEDALGRDVKEKEMHQCLEKLPENQQKCIKLFYLDNFSYKEIADQQQIEINKVRSFIQNGRRNLKNCMEAKALKKLGKE